MAIFPYLHHIFSSYSLLLTCYFLQINGGIKIPQVILINHHLGMRWWVNKLFGDGWQKLSFEQEVQNTGIWREIRLRFDEQEW
ncbi:MAG: hypothetical protein F6K48_32290 [Okeania sp. SIO3H1]|uniref:hypothetical protein n=1 Tax=Okeania sp. SIO1I7 TaxID=2607772 RepID=UPI0013C8D8F6|nr:hypothetical protein [Okeania sp. SIO1I7]NEN93312.1 hypothetical protein [Okeania sp. SIO3H1]NET25786.1 hypothetical protein [Okeania sp. SIO1I7]